MRRRPRLAPVPEDPRDRHPSTGPVRRIHPAYGCPTCLAVLDANTFAALDAVGVSKIAYFDAYHRAHAEDGTAG